MLIVRDYIHLQAVPPSAYREEYSETYISDIIIP